MSPINKKKKNNLYIYLLYYENGTNHIHYNPNLWIKLKYYTLGVVPSILLLRFSHVAI